MTEYLFAKMPAIEYNNLIACNITKRSKIIHGNRANINNYYPAELGDETRADSVAYQAWGDPFMDWMIWMNNNVVDPYFGWHLSEDEFQAYIIDKYGSIPVAEQTITYYRTTWPAEEVRITPGDYNTNLPGVWQKYFQPVYSVTDNSMPPLYYIQSRLDWRMNTNQLLEWNINMTVANTSFAVGNVVQVTSGGNVVGQGQVVESNSSILVVQHTSGNTNALQGLQDMFNTNITATISTTTVLQQNIPLTEAVFWEPLSFYDMEDEQNTIKRFFNMIDFNTAQQISAVMTKQFANTVF